MILRHIRVILKKKKRYIILIGNNKKQLHYSINNNYQENQNYQDLMDDLLDKIKARNEVLESKKHENKDLKD